MEMSPDLFDCKVPIRCSPVSEILLEFRQLAKELNKLQEEKIIISIRQNLTTSTVDRVLL